MGPAAEELRSAVFTAYRALRACYDLRAGCRNRDGLQASSTMPRMNSVHAREIVKRRARQ